MEFRLIDLLGIIITVFIGVLGIVLSIPQHRKRISTAITQFKSKTFALLKRKTKPKSTEELYLECLALLLQDQLEITGGWSKTYFWRQKINGKGLSPAGTFTGTLFSIEALLTGTLKLNDVPLIEELRKAIRKLLNEDGSYKRDKETSGQGRDNWREQNLRHTASAFLLRTLINDTIDDHDRLTINYIILSINNGKERLDYLDRAMILKCLCKHYITRKDPEIYEYIDSIWDYFYETSKLTKDSRFLWFNKSSESVVYGAVEQWYTIWAILPLLKMFRNINDNRAKEIIKAIQNLIIHTSNYKEDSLFPLAYKSEGNGIPFGQSICGSSLAIYTCKILKSLAPDIYDPKLDDVQNALFEALAKVDFNKYSLIFNEENPRLLQGYNDFASVLLCLSRFGKQITAEHIQTAKQLKVGKKISLKFDELGIKIENGLYIK